VSIEELFRKHLGSAYARKLVLQFDGVLLLRCCVELILASMCNVVQNAVDHGACDGLVHLHAAFDSLQGVLVIIVINQAGPSHQSMIQLQEERGPNFLFFANVYTDAKIRENGSTMSSFLGVDEIQRYVLAAGGSACINFHAESVETVLNFPAEPQQTLANPETPNVLSKPSSDVVYVLVDDDSVQRGILNALLKRSGGHPDSVVLGANYKEVANVPALVSALAESHGEEKIVVILDQNMDTWQGEKGIYGSDIIKQLGGVKFKGVMCLRTGQDDAESIEVYKSHGAKYIFMKSGEHMKLAFILDVVAKLLETANL